MTNTKVYGLLSEGTVQQPSDDREVLALVVGRQDNRVLVSLGSHDGRNCKGGIDSKKEDKEEKKWPGNRQTKEEPQREKGAWEIR
jgi:hypothetical protein